MSIRDLSRMMRPTSVALIGRADVGVTRLAEAVVRNLRGAGYGGPVIAVGTSMGVMDGIDRQVLSLADVPSPPDFSILLSPPGSLVADVAHLASLGCKVAVALTGRPAEGGSPPLCSLHEAVRKAARPHGMRIIGLNSLGVAVPGASLNASLSHVQPLKGKLALVAQSGAVTSAVLDWATARGIGFSAVMALGTMVDVDFGDVLDLLAADMSTQAILLCTEGITRVRKFMSAARQVARMKPVIVLKSARFPECVRSVATQGAHELGSDEVYDAAFLRAGLLRVFDIQSLFGAAETLARARAIPGDRLAILANGGGMGVLAADRLRSGGGQLPRLSVETVDRLSALLPRGCPVGMPLDIQADAAPELYADALDALLDDGGVDVVLVLSTPSALTSNVEAAEAVVGASRRHDSRPRANRILTCWLGDRSAESARRKLIDASIPTYDTPEAAVQGHLQIRRYRRVQDMLMETPPSIPEAFQPDVEAAGLTVRGALRQGRGELTAAEVRSILESYGISMEASARDAGSCLPELMIRVFVDVQFGPVIVFGHGGRAADLIRDKACALPPLNLHLAREVMSRTRIVQLLRAKPGVPETVLDAAAIILTRVSQLICDIPEISRLEINPLWVHDSRAWVGDALIQAEAVANGGRHRMVIRPYPKELEAIITLPDGQKLLLRPIRPEDEPAYHRLFATLPPEDILMRFMNPMRMLPHSLAARLTQIDYDREMALVLADTASTGETELYGGVRISADADNAEGEFAILLRRDMTGLGLGPMMMRRIIDYARRNGLGEIYGEVLSENLPMLKLCKALGFNVRRTLDDPGVMTVTLALRDRGLEQH
jgi:acyl-CoA synthetase (NDP forming)/RimJ/RimL family protein N-acetyltransferase